MAALNALTGGAALVVVDVGGTVVTGSDDTVGADDAVTAGLGGACLDS